MSTVEAQKVNEQEYSLTAQEDYCKVIDQILKDLCNFTNKKEESKDFTYLDLKKNMIAVMYNSRDYTTRELREIKNETTELIKTFPEIEVENDVMQLVNDNQKEYEMTMTETCKQIINPADDFRKSLDKIYEEIYRRDKDIKEHFENLKDKLGVELDYGACIKLKETSIQKIERDSACKGNGQKCFDNLKDLLRCRCTIKTLAEMEKILKYFQYEHDVLQVKNALDRKVVPTVYIVYRMFEEFKLPPVEFQILYKERNHHIHDFYDLSRLESDPQFLAWAMYNISKMFPEEYAQINLDNSEVVENKDNDNEFKKAENSIIADLKPEKIEEVVENKDNDNEFKKAENSIIADLKPEKKEEVPISEHDYTLFTGSRDLSVAKIDTKTGQVLATYQNHSYGVTYLALSQNSEILFSGSWDRKVVKIDTKTGKVLATYQNIGKAVTCLALSQNSEILFSGSLNCSIVKIDTKTGQVLATYQNHSDEVFCLALSQNSEILFSGSYDCSIVKIDTKTGQVLATYQNHSGGVTCLALSQNSEILFSGSMDRTVVKIDTKTGQVLATYQNHSHYVFCLALSQNSEILFSGSLDCSMIDTKTGQVLATYDNHSNAVTCLALSQNSEILFSGSLDRKVVKIDTKTGKVLATYQNHSGGVDCLALSPNKIY